MRSFRDIKVWARSHAVTLSIYEVTRTSPKDELYSLSNQMRRAATSMPANIAEGSGRGSDADFARFVQMAIGSASEVEYLLLRARDLRYVEAAKFQDLEERVINVSLRSAEC